MTTPASATGPGVVAVTTTPGSLAARAITEDRHRRATDTDGADDQLEDLPRWTRRDNSARPIAVQLAVDSDTVAVIDDHVRWYGLSRSPGDLITITDPVTSQVLRFVPDFAAYDRRWLLIDECPECGGAVPMALVTLAHALWGRFATHARIARWTLPLWLYVAVTGVLVYWILYHLYPGG